MPAILEVNGELLTFGEFRSILQAGLNRTSTRARTLAARKTSEVYNLSTRALAPLIRVRRVTRNSATLEGGLDLKVQNLPIQAFRPRVVMRTFTYVLRGKTVTRRLPTVEVQRLRGEPFKTVQPAFPAKQRRSGQLRRSEKVYRRLGQSRKKLTSFRYYTFPRLYIDDTLKPMVKEFVRDNLERELAGAFKGLIVRRGIRKKARGQS